MKIFQISNLYIFVNYISHVLNYIYIGDVVTFVN